LCLSSKMKDCWEWDICFYVKNNLYISSFFRFFYSFPILNLRYQYFILYKSDWHMTKIDQSHFFPSKQPFTMHQVWKCEQCRKKFHYIFQLHATLIVLVIINMSDFNGFFLLHISNSLCLYNNRTSADYIAFIESFKETWVASIKTILSGISLFHFQWL
jgi:hypothetical protein